MDISGEVLYVHAFSRGLINGPFLAGSCFQGDFQEGKGPLTHSEKRPKNGGERPVT